MSGPDGGYILPANVNPPTFCMTLEVPDDPQYIAALAGALWELQFWYNWQRDSAHTAIPVTRLWRKLIQEAFDRINAGHLCPVSSVVNIAEMDYEMSICEQLRFQNGKLQGFCCGEWVDISGQGDVAIGDPGQQGGGTEQPEPGGNCVTYHAQFDAKSQYLIPTVVNAGDTLTFSNRKGSGYDGSFASVWHCPNGQTFFAGGCIGVGGPTMGDPAAAVNHMALIVQIDGTWYPAYEGTITVPGGVVNAQATMQVNDSTLTDNSGSYSIDIAVCNNTPADWTHTINLATSQPLTIFYNPSYSTDPTGEWAAGEGYKTKAITTVSSGNHYTYLEAYQQFSAATTLTSIQLVFDEAPGSNTAAGNLGNYILWRDSGGAATILLSSIPVTGTGVLLTWIGSQVAHGLAVQLWTGDNNPGDGNPGGHARLYQMTVAGKGFDPFV